MQIKDLMTREVRTVSSSASLKEAARAMADMDVGALPVQDDARLVGMITDRDIAVRAVALGKGPDATVGEVMTHDVHSCFEDQAPSEVCAELADRQVRRLPVISREERLVGIVSLADLAANSDAEAAGETLEAITRPGGEHSQSADAALA